MRSVRIVVLLAVLASATAAWAGAPVTGWLQIGDDTVEPTHAVALRGVSRGFDRGSAIIDVLLSAAPIDTSGMHQALDRKQAICDSIDGDYAVVTLKEDGSLHYVFVFIDEGAKNYGFRGGTATTDVVEAGRVVAHACTEKEESLGGTPYTYDVRFDSPILDPRPQGQQLGDGGGAPGAAYLKLLAAMRERDVETLTAHMEPYAAQRLAEMDDEWRGYTLDELESEAPLEMTVVNGELFDGWSILKVEGTDANASKVGGAVKMIADGDTWRFAEEDLHYVW